MFSVLNSHLLVPPGCHPHDDHTSQQPSGGTPEVSGTGQELTTEDCSGLILIGNHEFLADYLYIDNRGDGETVVMDPCLDGWMDVTPETGS